MSRSGEIRNLARRYNIELITSGVTAINVGLTDLDVNLTSMHLFIHNNSAYISLKELCNVLGKRDHLPKLTTYFIRCIPRNLIKIIKYDRVVNDTTTTTKATTLCFNLTKYNTWLNSPFASRQLFNNLNRGTYNGYQLQTVNLKDRAERLFSLLLHSANARGVTIMPTTEQISQTVAAIPSPPATPTATAIDKYDVLVAHMAQLISMFKLSNGTATVTPSTDAAAAATALLPRLARIDKKLEEVDNSLITINSAYESARAEVRNIVTSNQQARTNMSVEVAKIKDDLNLLQRTFDHITSALTGAPGRQHGITVQNVKARHVFTLIDRISDMNLTREPFSRAGSLNNFCKLILTTGAGLDCRDLTSFKTMVQQIDTEGHQHYNKSNLLTIYNSLYDLIMKVVGSNDNTSPTALAAATPTTPATNNTTNNNTTTQAHRTTRRTRAFWEPVVIEQSPVDPFAPAIAPPAEVHDDGFGIDTNV